jgi:hypothetical protein
MGMQFEKRDTSKIPLENWTDQEILSELARGYQRCEMANKRPHKFGMDLVSEFIRRLRARGVCSF